MDDKKVKLCVICGAPVTAKWHTKTCSTACSNALRDLQNKEAAERRKINNQKNQVEKVCVICGNRFLAKDKRKQTCSVPCSNQLKSWHMKERHGGRRSANKQKLSISDIETMARNAHMSYGKFVAKYLTSSLSKQSER